MNFRFKNNVEISNNYKRPWPLGPTCAPRSSSQWIAIPKRWNARGLERCRSTSRAWPN